MKQHIPVFAFFVVGSVFACYVGWALVTGTLGLRGVAEPIRRRDEPRAYWYFMGIILGLCAIAMAGALWFIL